MHRRLRVPTEDFACEEQPTVGGREDVAHPLTTVVGHRIAAVDVGRAEPVLHVTGNEAVAEVLPEPIGEFCQRLIKNYRIAEV